METFICSKCNATKTINKTGAVGYAYTANKEKICYDCCAIEDVEWMRKNGRITLYFLQHLSRVSNWPGTLSFDVLKVKVGKHNFARKRYDVWFKGPDNKFWHGVQYGDNTELIHCKQLK